MDSLLAYQLAEAKALLLETTVVVRLVAQSAELKGTDSDFCSAGELASRSEIYSADQLASKSVEQLETLTVALKDGCLETLKGFWKVDK